jgi:hypothetical protein
MKTSSDLRNRFLQQSQCRFRRCQKPFRRSISAIGVFATCEAQYSQSFRDVAELTDSVEKLGQASDQ